MNKTLPNPYYLFSFQHIASKDRVSFIPEVVLTNTRYDKFRFIEGPTNPSTNPLTIQFPYEGQYYYSIYEQVSSGNTNIDLTYNKLESGRAVVIVGDDQTDACFFEPYISNNEDDANIIYISEEEQFCISGDTTPTPTASNTVTPTTTPTNTPTPTPTPTPLPDSPATLNALWWIDFTDASTLTFDGVNIETATDKIANVVFSAENNIFVTGPIYNSTGYLGLSGSVQSNQTQLKNQSGDYSNVGEYTWFGFVYDDVSQRGGRIFAASDNPGFPSGTNFSFMHDLNNIGPVWTFQNRTNSGGAVILDTDITYSAWTAVAMRSYNSGTNTNFEVWNDGSIIASGTTGNNVYVATDPIFSLMFDLGINFNTEQFFFDKKLTNGEMTQMFTYLTNKY